ncbi:MAG TPA: hypothetical protein VFQ85_16720 [Mycobacteriales bacterium]|jgi:hypothetical protein|nr:hypothetical protein [Mycobacteriales bacterium]
MGWITRSVEEHTLLWLLLSSLVGGIIGSGVKFLFEDVLRPRLGTRRETRAVTNRYATPLVRSAEALERRINLLVINAGRDWWATSEYYRLSTLYAFGEHLAWIRLVEEDVGFLPFESSRKGRQFSRRLNGVFRALSSWTYFTGCADTGRVDASTVPRLMLTAVGEAMIREDRKGPRRFTEFALAYGTDPQFRRWFADLERHLADAVERGDDYAWDRLVAAGIALRLLVRWLDPKGRLVDLRPVAHHDLVRTPEVREALLNECYDALPPPAPVATPG